MRISSNDSSLSLCRPPFCFPGNLSFHLCLSTYPKLYLSVHLLMLLSIYLDIYPSIMYAYLSVFGSLHYIISISSACQLICVSGYLPSCLYIYLSIYLSTYLSSVHPSHSSSSHGHKYTHTHSQSQRDVLCSFSRGTHYF